MSEADETMRVRSRTPAESEATTTRWARAGQVGQDGFGSTFSDRNSLSSFPRHAEQRSTGQRRARTPGRISGQPPRGLPTAFAPGFPNVHVAPPLAGGLLVRERHCAPAHRARDGRARFGLRRDRPRTGARRGQRGALHRPDHRVPVPVPRGPGGRGGAARVTTGTVGTGVLLCPNAVLTVRHVAHEVSSR